MGHVVLMLLLIVEHREWDLLQQCFQHEDNVKYPPKKPENPTLQRQCVHLKKIKRTYGVFMDRWAIGGRKTENTSPYSFLQHLRCVFASFVFKPSTKVLYMSLSCQDLVNWSNLSSECLKLK